MSEGAASGCPMAASGDAGADEGHVTYGSYLNLDAVLASQLPRSDRHDELLFIILHQTMELWIKQILAEIDAAIEEVRADRPIVAYKHLARVSRIFATMTSAWDVLATMTPSDYTEFREVLGTSSGFQSDQFRTLEVRLGLREGPAGGPATRAARALPSLWAEANAAAARGGLPIPQDVLERPADVVWAEDERVRSAWAEAYRQPDRYWDIYQLAEKLVDIDDALSTWRYRHVMTVARIIGGKRGTGGSSGVGYLETTLRLRAFPELWQLRTEL